MMNTGGFDLVLMVRGPQPPRSAADMIAAAWRRG